MIPTAPLRDSLPDEALMQALQEGDPSAFLHLYKRYERRLYNFVLRYTRNTTQAEDILQETFLRLYRARRQYHPEAAFRPWLYTIARNLCRDLEHERRREEPVPTTLPQEIPDPGGTPLTHLLLTERAEKIREAIAALPERERLVLILSRYEGLQYVEIAEILRMTPDAVKMTAYRGLKALRKEFQ